MSFKENAYQQLSITGNLSDITAREQKALEKSWAKVFADELFPAIDEKDLPFCSMIRNRERILLSM